MGKVVLVTGGAGYIGSHTCKRLSLAGYLPVVYDDLRRGHADFVKWGPLVRGDILDTESLMFALKRYSPDAVIHFAAYAYVGESFHDPLSYYRNNVAGTLSLLQAMKSSAVQNIVFSSSCAVYGLASTDNIKEEHPHSPISLYGRTKSLAESMLQDFNYAYGLRSVSLRYFNAAGADPEGEIGEHHDPETHLIPLLLDVAAGRRSHIDIYGNDYPSEDGTCIRDYVHVADLADAHVRAMEKLLRGNSAASYNLGSGHGHSVMQLVRAVERVTRVKITVRITPRRPGDSHRLVCDPSRARAELQWRPEFSSLEDMLDHAWHWHRKRFNVLR
ncbi:UDP-glucose 4-epimerase GalE [Paenibacillus mesophilus]|uniref:UDP-glucose 4-epimerase GalE n=1 Tax=Paenibacillus mesophilus TaxID=2582849 RepID=UPI00110D3E40|nr:UDP-glucose 4-epimerase GalE [Paenibacillus mesophilus]TMV50005.1 UDP-glucose 4-epimerase GalE [Paenibacillus mesophilus]